MFEELRQHLFWMFDALKGGEIKQAYNEIKIIDQAGSKTQTILEHQNQAWKNLKKKACSTTNYYKQYENCVFSEFPIINKNIIRENQKNFLSKKYKIENLIQMSTSGSTGTPFICYQDRSKKKRVNAEVIYYGEKVGYSVGQNLSYIRTIVKQNQKSKLKQFIQNQTLLQCYKLNEEGIEKILNQIKDVKTKKGITLLAYASTYTAIKDYIRTKGISKFKDKKVSGLISGSEMLFDDTRNSMKNFFGCKMVSRYSNEENGILGQDEEINNVFVINEADYIIEILNDNGEKVKDGTIGHIVVTDLFNYAMPMIRYDTGDMGAIETIRVNGREKKVITNFSGRVTDLLFDTEGNAISPHAVTNCMWSFTDIEQFQLIQKGEKAFLLKLNVNEKFKREEELVESIKKVLGKDADIRIQKVQEIPVLASGKRRYVINEYRK